MMMARPLARPGCQQTVVSEYTHTSLSEGQQSALVEAFGLLSKRQHKGISVGSVLLVNDERVAGMARCARDWKSFLSSFSAEDLRLRLEGALDGRLLPPSPPSRIG